MTRSSRRNGAVAEVGWGRFCKGVELGVTNLITLIKACSKLSARDADVGVAPH